ncbi:hypothetical protein [Aquibacillus sediminis]|uniref:hypothetical protein n=1 Tax=Aquibacillus sediminis TaxID=2574734 RepID=UPI00110860E2|nr:hypothetical protein [Aquibacillus sediminis]
MKKIVVGVLTGAVLLGGATFTSAATNGEGEGLVNFGQMKPYIEEMHPDLSTKEQKEMFDNCHGQDGYMQNDNNQNMMSDF